MADMKPSMGFMLDPSVAIRISCDMCRIISLGLVSPWHRVTRMLPHSGGAGREGQTSRAKAGGEPVADAALPDCPKLKDHMPPQTGALYHIPLHP